MLECHVVHAKAYNIVKIPSMFPDLDRTVSSSADDLVSDKVDTVDFVGVPRKVRV